MLKVAINIAVFGAFVLIVAVLGFFLWQTLFASEKYGNGQEKSEPTYSEQQPRTENTSGTSASPRSSNPTDQAIVEYTKWLAIFTLFLVLATIGLFISGERGVQVARQSAKQSADSARDTLVASNRPWISILKVAPVSQLTWEEKGARLTISAVIKNVGKSPAFDVSTEASQFVSNPIQFDIGASVKKYCDDLRQKQIQRAAAGHRGDVLFPDDTLTTNLELLFNRQEIEAGVKAMGIPFFSPVLVICSDYKSPITKSEHSTGLAYMILKPGEQGMPIMPKPDETLNPSDFGLARVQFGSFAD
jgi:hypothetical protein